MKSQKASTKSKIRWIATLLLPIFFLTQFSEFAFASLHPIESLQSFALPELGFSKIPNKLGEFHTVYLPAKKTNTIIYTIQDAHASQEAQKKINELLKFLEKEQGIDALFIEGAAERLNPRLLNLFFNARILRGFWDRLLNLGLINGAVYFLLHHPSIPSYGLENPQAYRKNIDAYRRVLNEKEKTQIFLQDFETRLYQKTQKLHSTDFREFLEVWKTQFESEAEWTHYFSALLDASRKHLRMNWLQPKLQLKWPQLIRLHRILDVQKSFPLKSLKTEYAQLSLMLKKKNPVLIQQLGMLVELSEGQGGFQNHLPFSVRKLSEDLVEMMQQDQISFFRFQEIKKLLVYSIFQEEIRPEMLLEETRSLENQIFASLTKNEPLLKNILEFYRNFYLLKAGFNLELTREQSVEFTKRFKSKKTFGFGSFLKEQETVFRLIPEVIQFYQLAQAREKFMIEKVMEIGDGRWGIEKDQLQNSDSQPRVLVVVTGGYHSEGIHHLLQKNQMAYGSIRPKLTEKVEGHAYQQHLLGKFSTTATIDQIAEPVMPNKQLAFEMFGNSAAAALAETVRFESKKYALEVGDRRVVSQNRSEVRSVKRSRRDFLSALGIFALGVPAVQAELSWNPVRWFKKDKDPEFLAAPLTEPEEVFGEVAKLDVNFITERLAVNNLEIYAAKNNIDIAQLEKDIKGGLLWKVDADLTLIDGKFVPQVGLGASHGSFGEVSAVALGPLAGSMVGAFKTGVNLVRGAFGGWKMEKELLSLRVLQKAFEYQQTFLDQRFAAISLFYEIKKNQEIEKILTEHLTFLENSFKFTKERIKLQIGTADEIKEVTRRISKIGRLLEEARDARDKARNEINEDSEKLLRLLSRSKKDWEKTIDTSTQDYVLNPSDLGIEQMRERALQKKETGLAFSVSQHPMAAADQVSLEIANKVNKLGKLNRWFKLSFSSLNFWDDIEPADVSRIPDSRTTYTNDRKKGSNWEGLHFSLLGGKPVRAERLMALQGISLAEMHERNTREKIEATIRNLSNQRGMLLQNIHEGEKILSVMQPNLKERMVLESPHAIAEDGDDVVRTQIGLIVDRADAARMFYALDKEQALPSSFGFPFSETASLYPVKEKKAPSVSTRSTRIPGRRSELRILGNKKVFFLSAFVGILLLGTVNAHAQSLLGGLKTGAVPTSIMKISNSVSHEFNLNETFVALNLEGIQSKGIEPSLVEKISGVQKKFNFHFEQLQRMYQLQKDYPKGISSYELAQKLLTCEEILTELNGFLYEAKKSVDHSGNLQALETEYLRGELGRVSGVLAQVSLLLEELERNLGKSLQPGQLLIKEGLVSKESTLKERLLGLEGSVAVVPNTPQSSKSLELSSDPLLATLYNILSITDPASRMKAFLDFTKNNTSPNRNEHLKVAVLEGSQDISLAALRDLTSLESKAQAEVLGEVLDLLESVRKSSIKPWLISNVYFAIHDLIGDQSVLHSFLVSKTKKEDRDLLKRTAVLIFKYHPESLASLNLLSSSFMTDEQLKKFLNENPEIEIAIRPELTRRFQVIQSKRDFRLTPGEEGLKSGMFEGLADTAWWITENGSIRERFLTVASPGQLTAQGFQWDQHSSSEGAVRFSVNEKEASLFAADSSVADLEALPSYAQKVTYLELLSKREQWGNLARILRDLPESQGGADLRIKIAQLLSVNMRARLLLYDAIIHLKDPNLIKTLLSFNRQSVLSHLFTDAAYFGTNSLATIQSSLGATPGFVLDTYRTTLKRAKDLLPEKHQPGIEQAYLDTSLEPRELLPGHSLSVLPVFNSRSSFVAKAKAKLYRDVILQSMRHHREYNTKSSLNDEVSHRLLTSGSSRVPVTDEEKVFEGVEQTLQSPDWWSSLRGNFIEQDLRSMVMEAAQSSSVSSHAARNIAGDLLEKVEKRIKHIRSGELESFRWWVVPLSNPLAFAGGLAFIAALFWINRGKNIFLIRKIILFIPSLVKKKINAAVEANSVTPAPLPLIGDLQNTPISSLPASNVAPMRRRGSVRSELRFDNRFNNPTELFAEARKYLQNLENWLVQFQALIDALKTNREKLPKDIKEEEFWKKIVVQLTLVHQGVGEGLKIFTRLVHVINEKWSSWFGEDFSSIDDCIKEWNEFLNKVDRPEGEVAPPVDEEEFNKILIHIDFMITHQKMLLHPKIFKIGGKDLNKRVEASLKIIMHIERTMSWLIREGEKRLDQMTPLEKRNRYSLIAELRKMSAVMEAFRLALIPGLNLTQFTSFFAPQLMIDKNEKDPRQIRAQEEMRQRIEQLDKNQRLIRTVFRIDQEAEVNLRTMRERTRRVFSISEAYEPNLYTKEEIQVIDDLLAQPLASFLRRLVHFKNIVGSSLALQERRVLSRKVIFIANIISAMALLGMAFFGNFNFTFILTFIVPNAYMFYQHRKAIQAKNEDPQVEYYANRMDALLVEAEKKFLKHDVQPLPKPRNQDEIELEATLAAFSRETRETNEDLKKPSFEKIFLVRDPELSQEEWRKVKSKVENWPNFNRVEFDENPSNATAELALKIRKDNSRGRNLILMVKKGSLKSVNLVDRARKEILLSGSFKAEDICLLLLAFAKSYRIAQDYDQAEILTIMGSTRNVVLMPFFRNGSVTGFQVWVSQTDALKADNGISVISADPETSEITRWFVNPVQTSDLHTFQTKANPDHGFAFRPSNTDLQQVLGMPKDWLVFMPQTPEEEIGVDQAFNGALEVIERVKSQLVTNELPLHINLGDDVVGPLVRATSPHTMTKDASALVDARMRDLSVAVHFPEHSPAYRNRRAEYETIHGWHNYVKKGLMKGGFVSRTIPSGTFFINPLSESNASLEIQVSGEGNGEEGGNIIPLRRSEMRSVLDAHQDVQVSRQEIFNFVREALEHLERHDPHFFDENKAFRRKVLNNHISIDGKSLYGNVEEIINRYGPYLEMKILQQVEALIFRIYLHRNIPESLRSTVVKKGNERFLPEENRFTRSENRFLDEKEKRRILQTALYLTDILGLDIDVKTMGELLVQFEKMRKGPDFRMGNVLEMIGVPVVTQDGQLIVKAITKNSSSASQNLAFLEASLIDNKERVRFLKTHSNLVLVFGKNEKVEYEALVKQVDLKQLALRNVFIVHTPQDAGWLLQHTKFIEKHFPGLSSFLTRYGIHPEKLALIARNLESAKRVSSETIANRYGYDLPLNADSQIRLDAISLLLQTPDFYLRGGFKPLSMMDVLRTFLAEKLQEIANARSSAASA